MRVTYQKLYVDFFYKFTKHCVLKKSQSFFVFSANRCAVLYDVNIAVGTLCNSAVAIEDRFKTFLFFVTQLLTNF